MIFEIKMEDFCHKARLVARGLMIKTSAILTYTSVVSRETVQISLILSSLNDIDKWAASVLNAEKICTDLGKEFSIDYIRGLSMGSN